MTEENTLRKNILKRWSSLSNERSSWIAHWREISDVVSPRSGRFLHSQRNMGNKRHNKIYDSTSTRALNVLAAGLMSGLTSPSRPWFRLATTNQEMNDIHQVKTWLAQVEHMMQTVFQQSNIYTALHNMYEELGAYGTAACVILPDYDDVIRCYPLTIGEYAIATNWRGEVDTLYREFDKTVAEIVGEFGIENVSESVKNMYENRQFDEWITIIHAIEPRKIDKSGRADAKSMPFKSVYIEKGGDSEKVLRESGFKRFPAICPRWSVSGGDIYGASPAMVALGDIKQLQHEQMRKSSAIDYQTNPPIQAPTAMKGRNIDMLPGGISFYDAASGDGIKTAWQVNLDLRYLLEDISDVRQRINAAFYADLFLMISSAAQPNMTATEVAERHEEKMLMLGPVLERLQNELIDPLISITFDAMFSAGILPPPPDELQGADINVVLLSILSQAQRSVGVNSIDRFVGSLAGMAQIKPDVLDNLNGDSLVEIYADSLGVDPRIMNSPEDVAAIREQRAAQQNAQSEAALAQQGADIAQTLAQAQALSQ